jgi:hypothetical protein
MIKIIKRKTNIVNYCCTKSHKINEISLLVIDQRNYKSFDYYSDKACKVCGHNNIKYFVIRKNNKEIK